MMKKYFFSAVFLLLVSLCYAQIKNANIEWHEGIIILENDEIVKGELGYDYANDLIMCKEDGKIRTFGPHQAVSFQFYEIEKNLLRRFKVYELAQNSFYSQQGFFEIVVDGEVDYIRKRNRYALYHPRDGYMVHRKPNMHEVAYDYFVQVNGKLIKARKFKKEVLPQLLLTDQSVEKYMKEQKLTTYDIGDQIVLLNYYNKKSDKAKPTAKDLRGIKTGKSGSD
jgi:hypothetical protein